MVLSMIGMQKKVYSERFLRTSRDTKRDVWEYYEQAPWRHHTHRVLAALSLRFHRQVNALDPLAERLHELRCHDDCTTAEVWRRTPGDTASMPLGPAEEMRTFQREHGKSTVQTYCGRAPLCAAVDIRLFEFHHKDRKVVNTVLGPERAHDEPAG